MIMKCWVLLLLAMQAGAQSRWTGAGLNNRWNDAANWHPAGTPGELDDVLLDNSLFPSGYRVTLPDSAVRVKSLRILPGAATEIFVELPPSNLNSSPSGSTIFRAFETLGSGYTLEIGEGGTFLNAAGSSSGYALRIGDSIRIANGGMYIHRTRTGHAELVQQLSRLPGTETGIFRFENTDAASTFSLSGRTFGTIQLSAAAAPAGSISYSSSGTNKVMVRGNLELEPGVSFSLHFDDTLQVEGDLRIDSASFNLSSGNRSPVLLLRKNWIQKGGSVYESNISGRIATIILGAASLQSVNCSGLISDSILISVRNSGGVSIDAPLRINYGLELSRGVVYSGNPSRLYLAKGSFILADSSSGQSYIEGSLVREGLAGAYSHFPLGLQGKNRWVSLKGVHGDISVAYHRETAYNVGQVMGTGIDHVSQLEYWAVKKLQAGDFADADARLELSFEEQLSGGVSYLPDLRVAAFQGGRWENAGNSATTGSAFASGSVTSSSINGFGSDQVFFTLASASASANTLPVLIEKLWIEESPSAMYCNWQVSGWEDAVGFELEISEKGREYSAVGKIPAIVHQRDYRLLIPTEWKTGWCRIRYLDKNGLHFNSKSIRFNRQRSVPGSLLVNKPPGAGYLIIRSPENMDIKLEVSDVSGRLLYKNDLAIQKGINQLALNTTGVLPGIHIIRITGKHGIILVQQVLW